MHFFISILGGGEAYGLMTPFLGFELVLNWFSETKGGIKREPLVPFKIELFFCILTKCIYFKPLFMCLL